jgi:hypothetical protein
MSERLPADITTCTPEEMFDALGYAWVQLFNETPKKESLLCLLCQWALETGWGKECYAWNIGNFKSSDGDGRDFTYYKCDERFEPPQASHYVAGAQPRSDGSGKPNCVFESNNKDGTVSVYFWPDHPVSRFRAYHTLHAGAIDYVSSLFNRFKLAWPAIKAGDPDQFVHQLKAQGYFTADENSYKHTVDSLFVSFEHKTFDMSTLPVFSDAYAAQVQGLVALTTAENLPAWGGPEGGAGPSDTGSGPANV